MEAGGALDMDGGEIAVELASKVDDDIDAGERIASPDLFLMIV